MVRPTDIGLNIINMNLWNNRNNLSCPVSLNSKLMMDENISGQLNS